MMSRIINKVSSTVKLLAVVACTILSTVLIAGNAAPFQQGDVICFLGDSITHGGRYPFYVLGYYATRYPQRKIVIHNCGISGDTARGAWKRLQWDLLDRKPNKTTIMLGMNDVHRGLYGKKNPDEKNLKSRKRALDTHKNRMNKIVEKLKGNNIEVIYITPSPYDQTVKGKAKNLFGVNDVLGKCAEFCKQQAVKNNAGLVDFHQPMTEIILNGQKIDPKFSLIGKDRVHPPAVGHYVMAYLFLKSQKVPSIVSSMSIDYPGAKILAEKNCKVSNLKKSGNALSFDCLEKSLPMPVDKNYKRADKIVPLTKDLNRETLAFSTLPKGEYALYIDGQKVIKADASAWEKGVNLAILSTPMQKQALAVAALVEKKRRAESTLRNLCKIEISMRGKKVDINNAEAREKYFDEFLKKVEKSPYIKYYTYLVKNYRASKPKEKELQATVNKMNSEIYKNNAPKTHHFELKKI